MVVRHDRFLFLILYISRAMVAPLGPAHGFGHSQKNFFLSIIKKSSISVYIKYTNYIQHILLHYLYIILCYNITWIYLNMNRSGSIYKNRYVMSYCFVWSGPYCFYYISESWEWRHTKGSAHCTHTIECI